MLGNLNADKYDRQYSDGYLFKRIVTYFRPHKGKIISVAVLVLAFATVTSLIPVMIAHGINLLQTEAPGEQISVLIGALLLAAFLEYIFYFFRRRITGRVVGDVISQIRKDAFDAAIRRDIGFYDENKSGKIVSRITNDTQELNQIILIAADILTQFFEFAVLFVVLVNRDWRLTLLLMLMMPVVIFVTGIFRKLARTATRQGSRAMAAVNDNIQESVSGISVAKNFRQEAMIYDEFIEVNRESYSINLRRGVVLAMVFPTLNALMGFAIGGVTYIGAQFVLSGVMDVGTWYLYVQGIDRFWFPFLSLSSFWSQLQGGLSALERIFALIDAENVVNQTDNVIPPALTGKVEFKDVTFRYKSGDPVLTNFNLTIHPGESIAFVGHTGAGKSTIAKLIERFYEFQDGEILIDGYDIRTLDIHEFRRHLGIVPQAPFLFSGTILENIRYAQPTATDEEIMEVCKSIGGGGWIDTLPEGLHSEVGERGSRLSMGQRQLVSLLRVLVQKPAIFILDEATASIDPFTETQIQEALDMILSRSSSILIAHRLSTVRSADRIIVLKQGKIIESGDHQALMEQGGHYAELYDTYFRHQSLDYIEGSKTVFSQATD